MKTYTYTGPKSAVTIGETDVLLNTGETIELNDSNKFVQRLVSKGLLVETSAKLHLKPIPAPEADEPDTKHKKSEK